MVPRYPGTLTVSVNNKNVEIDPVFCRPRPPPIFLVDMYILTSYTTYQVSHEYLHALTNNKTLIDTNKAFSYYLVGRYIIEDVPKEAAEETLSESYRDKES